MKTITNIILCFCTALVFCLSTNIVVFAEEEQKDEPTEVQISLGDSEPFDDETVYTEEEN